MRSRRQLLRVVDDLRKFEDKMPLLAGEGVSLRCAVFARLVQAWADDPKSISADSLLLHALSDLAEIELGVRPNTARP